MSTKKIKTKQEAYSILNELQESLSAILQSIESDALTYKEAIKQIKMMKNSVSRNKTFFNDIFLDKTPEEIQEWVESESKKW